MRVWAGRAVWEKSMEVVLTVFKGKTSSRSVFLRVNAKASKAL